MVTTTLLRRKDFAPHSSCLEVTVRESQDITQVKGTLTGRTSASLAEVKLDLSGLFRQNARNKKLRKLFKTLGDLPYLKTLRFHYSTVALERLPVHLLTIALEGGKRLEILELNQVNLTGTEEEFAVFFTTLRTHASLSVFSFSSSGCCSASSINEVLEAISVTPKMERVVLYSPQGRCPWGRLNGAALNTLCQSPTLKDLQHLVLYDSSASTGNFFADEHTMALAQALSNPQARLQEVMISCWPLGQAGVRTLCQMLQTNQSLQKLTMVIYELGDDNNTDETCNLGELATALLSNSTLKTLELHGSTDLGKWIEEDFWIMMQSNFCLTSLKLCQDKALFSRRFLDFYLKLNAAGRGQLMQNENAATAQWVDSLIRVRDDLSCLFYFLSSNPLLCG